jgi:hypothetical protein
MSRIKLNLRKVDPVKYGLITGLLMALLSLIMIVPMMLIMSAAGAGSESLGAGAAIFGGGIIMIILLPILYGIFGFIIGLITTALMNFILKKTNGLDIEFETNSDFEISQLGKEDTVKF